MYTQVSCYDKSPGDDRELFLYFSLRKYRSFIQDQSVVSSHVKIIYDAYMQELNAVVLYVVIFVPSQFWLASVLLTPVLAGILQETNA